MPRFQMDLKDGIRTDFKGYFPSGHVIVHERYDSQEMRHGPFQTNNRDGTMASRGRYEHGERVGLWYHFHRDGSIANIKDHSTSPPTMLQFARGEREITPKELATVERE
jgi:hypothetical protein